MRFTPEQRDTAERMCRHVEDVDLAARDEGERLVLSFHISVGVTDAQRARLVKLPHDELLDLVGRWSATALERHGVVSVKTLRLVRDSVLEVPS